MPDIANTNFPNVIYTRLDAFPSRKISRITHPFSTLSNKIGNQFFAEQAGGEGQSIRGISNSEQGISNDEGKKGVNGYQVNRKSGAGLSGVGLCGVSPLLS